MREHRKFEQTWISTQSSIHEFSYIYTRTKIKCHKEFIELGQFIIVGPNHKQHSCCKCLPARCSGVKRCNPCCCQNNPGAAITLTVNPPTVCTSDQGNNYFVSFGSSVSCKGRGSS